jgi:hypothetical protein
MVGLVQKLEIFLSICGLFTHLLMLSNILARSSLLFCSTFSKYGFRYLIRPLYGWSSSMYHQYGMEWAFSCAWVGMLFSGSILLPSFANLSASSLPIILVCALILCRVVGAVQFFSSVTIMAIFCSFIWMVVLLYRVFYLGVYKV